MDILNEIIAMLNTLSEEELRLIYRLLMGFTKQ